MNYYYFFALTVWLKFLERSSRNFVQGIRPSERKQLCKARQRFEFQDKGYHGVVDAEPDLSTWTCRVRLVVIVERQRRMALPVVAVNMSSESFSPHPSSIVAKSLPSRQYCNINGPHTGILSLLWDQHCT